MDFADVKGGKEPFAAHCADGSFATGNAQIFSVKVIATRGPGQLGKATPTATTDQLA